VKELSGAYIISLGASGNIGAIAAAPEQVQLWEERQKKIKERLRRRARRKRSLSHLSAFLFLLPLAAKRTQRKGLNSLSMQCSLAGVVPAVRWHFN
jgi:hypothetical protein